METVILSCDVCQAKIGGTGYSLHYEGGKSWSKQWWHRNSKNREPEKIDVCNSCHSFIIELLRLNDGQKENYNILKTAFELSCKMGSIDRGDFISDITRVITKRKN